MDTLLYHYTKALILTLKNDIRLTIEQDRFE